MPSDSVRKELLPVVVDMLQDELFDMRLRILEHIHEIGKVIGMATLVEAIQPMMEQMSVDQKWRIRSGVLGKISHFTKEAVRDVLSSLSHHITTIAIAITITITIMCFQGSSVYESSYHELLFRGLSDTVYEVRKICAAEIGQIVANFGADWAQKVIIPDALKMFDVSSNYLHRIVPLQVIAVRCHRHLHLSSSPISREPCCVRGALNISMSHMWPARFCLL